MFEVSPFSKQGRVVEIMRKKVLKGAQMTKKELLLEAGYSKYTARKPAQVFETPSFRRLFEKTIPPEDIVSKHKDLLDSKELKDMEFPVDMTDSTIEEIIQESGLLLLRIHVCENAKIAYYVAPTAKIILSAIDMAYKIGGYYEHKTVEKPSIDLVALFNGAMALRREQTLKTLREEPFLGDHPGSC